MLKKLEDEQPDTFKRVLELKEQKEGDLDTETVTLDLVPSRFFRRLWRATRSSSVLPRVFRRRATRVLAGEAVADWLLRCPLEF